MSSELTMNEKIWSRGNIRSKLFMDFGYDDFQRRITSNVEMHIKAIIRRRGAPVVLPSIAHNLNVRLNAVFKARGESE